MGGSRPRGKGQTSRKHPRRSRSAPPHPASPEANAPLRKLESCTLFQRLAPGDMGEIFRRARERQVRKNAFYFHQGGRATDVYVLTRGKVKLIYQEPDGQEIILQFIMPAEAFGYIAVLGETPHLVSAQATEDSCALAWTAAAMERIVDRYPTVAFNSYRALARHVREAWDRLHEAIMQSMERRVAWALLRLADSEKQRVRDGSVIELTLSGQDLAEFVGTTPSTVSRILSHWESAGIVAVDRRLVVIRRPRALAALARGSPFPETESGHM